VTLSVQVSPGQLAITLLNPALDAPNPGRGLGLIGMRERVGLLDGSITAGYAHGQWRVSVQLPLPDGAA
jgi:glucose-6-phosphate-specific signal transduction histidine kinase